MITLNDAQKALGHLRNNQGSKPPLLQVKGWDKSKKIYQLKNTLEETFKNEIDRFRDLAQERQELQQAYQKDDVSDSYRKELEEQAEEINDEMNELLQVEKEVEIDDKLTEEGFGDVIDAEIFIDLNFAIE